MRDATGPEAILALYGERINNHRFDDLVDLLSDDASFWFSEGSFRGEAIRAAFERTWALVKDEHYWLEDIEWIALADTAASCTYRFAWRGVIDGKAAQGSGRGTTVLRREPGSWKIVHEHLSPLPA